MFFWGSGRDIPLFGSQSSIIVSYYFCSNYYWVWVVSLQNIRVGSYFIRSHSTAAVQSAWSLTLRMGLAWLLWAPLWLALSFLWTSCNGSYASEQSPEMLPCHHDWANTGGHLLAGQYVYCCLPPMAWQPGPCGGTGYSRHQNVTTLSELWEERLGAETPPFFPTKWNKEEAKEAGIMADQ